MYLKSLIRFEDTYGIADIFCAVHGTNYLDIGLVRTEMIKMDDNTYIDFGLGASWHKLTDDEAYAMIELGYNCVFLLFEIAKTLDISVISTRVLYHMQPHFEATVNGKRVCHREISREMERAV